MLRLKVLRIGEVVNVLDGEGGLETFRVASRI